jgi:hypothetical protein
MADAIVVFEKVSKSYDGKTLVVDGLDLALALLLLAMTGVIVAVARIVVPGFRVGAVNL